MDKDENSTIQIIRTKNTQMNEINTRFDEKQARKIFSVFFWKTLDKHQNLWYNRGTSKGTNKTKGEFENGKEMVFESHRSARNRAL